MKKWLYVFGFLAVSGVIYAQTPSSDIDDYFTIKGRGTEYNTSVGYIDSNKNFNISGGVYLGIQASTPSFTVGTHPGLKVPFVNKSGAVMVQGTVVVSSTTNNSQTGWGSQVAILATTTVLGVNDSACAVNAVCWMTVSGYALVLTTGAVQVGNILVSTAGTNNAGAAGYAGVTTGTQVVGTEVGIAASSGTASGGLTLILRK